MADHFKPGELMAQPRDTHINVTFGSSAHSDDRPRPADVDIQGIIDHAAHKAAAAESWLEEMLGLDGAFVDEVALQFKDDEARRNFIERAVMLPDVEHFNADEDDVWTSPIRSTYRVRYDFLRIKGKAFRLECMSIKNGVSPLHAATEAYIHGEYPWAVHVSFKVPTMHEYQRVAKVLDEAGCVLAQGCTSSYGVFSYWVVDGDPVLDGIYLKPRVNKRDK